jgi:hypothetical protein
MKEPYNPPRPTGSTINAMRAVEKTTFATALRCLIRSASSTP